MSDTYNVTLTYRDRKILLEALDYMEESLQYEDELSEKQKAQYQRELESATKALSNYEGSQR